MKVENTIQAPSCIIIGMHGMHVGPDGGIVAEGECTKYRAIAHKQYLELRSDTDVAYIGWGVIRAIRGTAERPM
jgi:hypothetical protein